MKSLPFVLAAAAASALSGLTFFPAVRGTGKWYHSDLRSWRRRRDRRGKRRRRGHRP